MGVQAPRPTMSPLSRRDCLALLNDSHLGRIAWQAADAVQVLPITFTVFEEKVYFRTSPDSILSELLRPTPVALEIDELHLSTRTGWSVVMHGWSRAVAEPDEVTKLWAVDPLPWAPGGRRLSIQLTADQITGRILHREPE